MGVRASVPASRRQGCHRRASARHAFGVANLSSRCPLKPPPPPTNAPSLSMFLRNSMESISKYKKTCRTIIGASTLLLFSPINLFYVLLL
ncbi:unnamed protein product, partial [Iphiclides podalirius]